MFNKVKSTFKHTFFYALGNIAPKLSGFILLPIYTRLIPVADYGILGLLELVEMLAIQILSLGMYQVLLRWHGLADSEMVQKKHTFTILAFLASAVILADLLVLPWRHEIANFIFEQDLGDYLSLVFISVSFAIILRVALTLMRAEQKSGLYALAIFAQFGINLTANIYLVAVLKLQVKGILIAQLLGTGAIFLTMLPYLSRRMKPNIDPAGLREMLRFSYPLTLAAVASIVFNIGDRFILKQLGTLQELGQYTLAYKFSNIMKMTLVDSFTLGLPAIAWQIIKNDDNPKRFFSKTMTYLIFCLLWCGLAISVYSTGLIHAFAENKDYWGADRVVPILLLALVFNGMQALFFFELQIPKQTRYIAIIIGVAAMFNIALNLILIPHFGMMGAAFVTLISQIASVILGYMFTRKAYHVKYETGRIVLIFLVAAGLYAITSMFDGFGLLMRIALKGIVVLSFPFVLYLLNFYEPVEVERIRTTFTNVVTRLRVR